MLQTSFTNIANKLNVENDIEYKFDTLFETYLPKIRKLIKDRWLSGKKPNGNDIGLYDDGEYEKYKFFEVSDKAGYGKVDLTLTGDLGNGIDIGFIDAGEYEIFSNDYKYEDIIERYGEDNFNITEQETEQIAKEITTKIVIELLKKAYYG